MAMLAYADIQAAAARLKGRLVRTPFRRSRLLSAMSGADIIVKFENQQSTASFKERGALNKLLTLDAAARRRGVSAMSAGNHAQGVAYHARELGVPALIVMPEQTPFIKVEQTRSHGAEVVLAGTSLVEAAAEAARLTELRGLTFIHPFDDPVVMAGQGTVALEMMEDAPAALDAVIVPVGGGGLISGMATAIKGQTNSIEVVGVQAATYPSMVRALAGHEPEGSGNTVAEGIAVKYPGALTREVVRARVDDILLVEESDMERAIALFLSVEKTVTEGAGAAALAAVLAHPDRFRGRTVGLILSGGNIDSRLLASIIVRELARDGRIVTLRLPIPDQPGVLAKISTLVAEEGANVIEVQHHRRFLTLPAKEAILDLTFEARDRPHAERVIAAVHAAGFAATVIET